MIFYIKNIKHTYLHCGHRKKNTTLFGEKRVVFQVSSPEDVIDSGIYIRNPDSGEESYVDSEGISCALDEVNIGIKRDTEEKILTCREKSNLGVLQYGIEKNLTDLPEFPESDVKAEQTERAVHNNAHVIDKIYHAESAKGLYKLLDTLGNVRTDAEYRLFVNVLSEDVTPGEKTGSSLDNIQDTWLGNNGERRGIFNALHHKDGGVGKIQNKTFLEYKKGKNPEKDITSEITMFMRDYSTDRQTLEEEMNADSFDFLTNEKEVVTDAKKLETTSLKTEIPNFFKFLKRKINTSQTQQLNNTRTVQSQNNQQIEQFVIEDINVLQSELKKINILLEDENIQKMAGKVLSENDISAMGVYKGVLEKMLESKELETKKNLLTEINKNKKNNINNNNNNNIVGSKIQKTIEKIELKKHEITKINTQYPIDANKIALLEQDIQFLEQEKSVYIDVQEMVSPLYPNASVYDDIFENIWKDGKVIGTKVKNMSSTIIDLKKYHEWIRNKMFAGVAVPSNPDVNAVLISSAYRGDISPKVLNSALLQMTHNNKNIAEFYENVASVMYSSNDEEAKAKFIAYLDQHPEFSAIQDALVDAAEFWNDHDLAGNTAQFSRNNPLALTEGNSRQSFQKNWGFNIELAYTQYKKLNTKKVKPNELDLQNLPKINNQVLDISLWVNNETKTVNNSPEMKNYLSQLLLNMLRISPDADSEIIEKTIEALDISSEKKQLYKQIIAKNWSADNPELMVFVQTLKSEFKAEEALEQKFNIKQARPAMSEVVKNMNDPTGKISESVSYIWDRATSGDLKYVGLVGALAYVMMKDTSAKGSSSILWLLKRGLWIGGGVAVANSVADDMFDFDIVDVGKELIMGENEKIALSPSGIPLSEMEKMNGVSEDVHSKEFKRAGIALANGNVKETLEWYNACNVLKNDSDRAVNEPIYSENLPSGIQHLVHKIYADEGAVGPGNTKEDAAHKVYDFLNLYFKHISLQLNPTAGEGLGNASIGYKSIADEFYYPDRIENNTYRELGTNDIKKGYTMADVMRARTARESIYELADKSSVVDSAENAVNEVVASIADDELNTVKTDEKLMTD